MDEFNAHQLWLIINNTKVFADIYKFAQDDIDAVELVVQDTIKTRIEYYANKSDLVRFFSGFTNAFADMIGKVSEMDPEMIKQVAEKFGVKLPEGVNMQDFLGNFMEKPYVPNINKSL